MATFHYWFRIGYNYYGGLAIRLISDCPGVCIWIIHYLFVDRVYNYCGICIWKLVEQFMRPVQWSKPHSKKGKKQLRETKGSTLVRGLITCYLLTIYIDMLKGASYINLTKLPLKRSQLSDTEANLLIFSYPSRMQTWHTFMGVRRGARGCKCQNAPLNLVIL